MRKPGLKTFHWDVVGRVFFCWGSQDPNSGPLGTTLDWLKKHCFEQACTEFPKEQNTFEQKNVVFHENMHVKNLNTLLQVFSRHISTHFSATFLCTKCVQMCSPKGKLLLMGVQTLFNPRFWVQTSTQIPDAGYILLHKSPMLGTYFYRNPR